jgi:mannose-6-phosphate isomerase-like protein (cupin superfamily)
MLVEDPWQFAFALVGAVGSVATAIALFFLYRQSVLSQVQALQTQEQTRQAQEQTRLTREEMESTLRPWLGVSSIKRTGDSVDYLITNYGSIPTKIVKVQFVIGTISKISQTELRTSSQFEVTQLIVFPGSDINYTITSYSAEFDYMGILIHYEFPKDKNGEYGRIVHFTSAGTMTQEIFAK